MHLTVYTDYSLRVMMYLALKYPDCGVATIEEIAGAYGISRNHLTKIIHELSQVGLIETTRGRAGGARARCYEAPRRSPAMKMHLRIARFFRLLNSDHH